MTSFQESKSSSHAECVALTLKWVRLKVFIVIVCGCRLSTVGYLEQESEFVKPENQTILIDVNGIEEKLTQHHWYDYRTNETTSELPVKI